MLYNLHPVKVSVWSEPFDEFWHSQNHLHNQDGDHFHRPKKWASCPFAPFTLSPKHPLICLLSLEISFDLFEKLIKMKSYSVSYLAFSLSTRCFWDEFRESKVSVVYSLVLLDTIPLYPAICFSVHLVVDTWRCSVGGSQKFLWAFTHKSDFPGHIGLHSSLADT